MEHRYPSLLLLALATTTLRAQNLVPNPSFDIQDSCPAVSELFVAQPWDSPTLGTPDAFNSTCATQNGAGHTGIGSSGVYIYSTFPDNREYMQAPLTSPLVAGQTYCASFWVKRSDFRLGCDRVGAHLRTGAYSANSTGVIAFTPQVESPAGVILGGTSWHQISGTFTAAGGEDHILIGNFRNDAGTMTQVENAGNSSAVCYYRVDDVVIQSCVVGIEEDEADAPLTVFPQPATDVLHLALPASEHLVRADLMDMSGRLLISQGHRSDRTDIDVSALPEGSYVLMVTTDVGVSTQRVLVGGR